MDNGFKKFKRKICIGVILRSLLAGISLGLIVVAVQWLIAKLTAADPDFIKFGLIGGGTALVGFLVFFLFQLPTDRRLAKRLDDKLGLNEKVQTMIAFRNENSEMIQMQREDTQRILMQTPGKKARSKAAWLVMILPVLACACMVVTFIIPVKAQPTGPVVDPTSWLLDNFTEQKMKDLIEYVQTSGMQETPKGQIVTELESLLTKLKTVNKKVVMQETVVSSIKKIHVYAQPCHTHANIVKAMKASDSVVIQKLASSINGMDYRLLTTFVQADLLKLLDVENRAQTATAIASDIEAAVKASKEPAEHLLAAALTDVAEKLKTITDETTTEQLQALLKKADDTLAVALAQPIADVGVEEYTINHLMAIFGIPQDMIPPEILESFESGTIDGEANKPGDDENEQGPDGGLGNGQLVFGSNDTIYDPNREDYLPYGEVIDDYDEIFDALIREGNVAEDLAEMASDYLAHLFAKPAEPDDEN